MKRSSLRTLCLLLLALGTTDHALCEPNTVSMRLASAAANHPYRHGAVLPTPTKVAIKTSRAGDFRSMNFGFPVLADIVANTLSYGGGFNNLHTGVTSGAPRVYLVVLGSQWGAQQAAAGGFLGFSNDKNGEVLLLEQLFSSMGDGAERWSATMTQYCDGVSTGLVLGSTTCPNDALFIPYPSGGVLAGVWYDDAQPSLIYASAHDLAVEAVKAAGHFHNVSPDANRYAQYFILSPPQTHPDSFNTKSPDAVFCAWHDFTTDKNLDGGGVTSQYGDIAFTNMPYITDLSDCGANEVNIGDVGLVDGITIAASHEYAETLTDQYPPTGWVNLSPSQDLNQQEIGDECAFLASATTARQLDNVGAGNVVMHGRQFAVQALWSNTKKACTLATP